MSRAPSIFLSLAVLALSSSPLLADGTNAAAAAMPVPSAGVALVRMAGSLAVVIALFFGGVWCFRNVHRLKPAGGKIKERKLQVLEGKTLGPRQAVYVVAYEQQRMLIGASAQGLSLLTHLPECTEKPSPDSIVPVSFGEALLHALGRK